MSPLFVRSVTHTWHTGTEDFPIPSLTLALFRGGTSGNHKIKKRTTPQIQSGLRRKRTVVGKKRTKKPNNNRSTRSTANFKEGKKYLYKNQIQNMYINYIYILKLTEQKKLCPLQTSNKSIWASRAVWNSLPMERSIKSGNIHFKWT